jgi:hypothetical protein
MKNSIVCSLGTGLFQEEKRRRGEVPCHFYSPDVGFSLINQFSNSLDTKWVYNSVQF